jgi:DNA mismatch repair protein MutS
VHLSAIEQGRDLIFLHQVKPGHASQSYGLQVAQLAGVPKPIITQARKKLMQLEAQNDAEQLQSDLFAVNHDDALLSLETIVQEPHPVEIAVRELDPDSLSPREALEALYQLKKLLG